MAAAGEPTFSEAAQELGFHTDIDYLPSHSPLPRHFTLWRQVLPMQISDKIERFREIGPDIRRIAFDENLRSPKQTRGKQTGRTRRAIVDELLARLSAEDQGQPQPEA